jgi:UDP-N-acetylmuramoylalanine--D-glutamate ligase
VRERDGVRWVNDSIATNTFAARRGSRRSTRRVRLILGGRAKGEDFAPFARELPANVASIYLVGEASDELADALDAAGVVRRARHARPRASSCAAARRSPATSSSSRRPCASYDQFANFESAARIFEARREPL